jgi:hypothetical protein
MSISFFRAPVKSKGFLLMIEIVAHNDNCWPGAFRLHMKDTGFLLGIGRDVVSIARMRLDEEGIDGPLRITFAANGRVIRSKTIDPMSAWEPETVAEQMPDFKAAVDALMAAPLYENPFAVSMSETFPASAVPAEKETTAKRTATQLPSSPNRGFAPAAKKPAAKKKSASKAK